MSHLMKLQTCFGIGSKTGVCDQNEVDGQLGYVGTLTKIL